MSYAQLSFGDFFPLCLSEEEGKKLLELSPLFQMLKELQLLLEGRKGGAESTGKPTSCRKNVAVGPFLSYGLVKIRALFAL